MKKVLFLVFFSFLFISEPSDAQTKELLKNDKFSVEVSSDWCSSVAEISVKDKKTGFILSEIPTDLKNALDSIMAFECPAAKVMRIKALLPLTNAQKRSSVNLSASNLRNEGYYPSPCKPYKAHNISKLNFAQKREYCSVLIKFINSQKTKVSNYERRKFERKRTWEPIMPKREERPKSFEFVSNDWQTCKTSYNWKGRRNGRDQGYEELIHCKENFSKKRTRMQNLDIMSKEPEFVKAKKYIDVRNRLIGTPTSYPLSNLPPEKEAALKELFISTVLKHFENRRKTPITSSIQNFRAIGDDEREMFIYGEGDLQNGWGGEEFLAKVKLVNGKADCIFVKDPGRDTDCRKIGNTLEAEATRNRLEKIREKERQKFLNRPPYNNNWPAEYKACMLPVAQERLANYLTREAERENEACLRDPERGGSQNAVRADSYCKRGWETPKQYYSSDTDPFNDELRDYFPYSECNHLITEKCLYGDCK